MSAQQSPDLWLKYGSKCQMMQLSLLHPCHSDFQPPENWSYCRFWTLNSGSRCQIDSNRNCDDIELTSGKKKANWSNSNPEGGGKAVKAFRKRRLLGPWTGSCTRTELPLSVRSSRLSVLCSVPLVRPWILHSSWKWCCWDSKVPITNFSDHKLGSVEQQHPPSLYDEDKLHPENVSGFSALSNSMAVILNVSSCEIWRQRSRKLIAEQKSELFHCVTVEVEFFH